MKTGDTGPQILVANVPALVMAALAVLAGVMGPWWVAVALLVLAAVLVHTAQGRD
jgi:hypothetical protein